MKKQRLSDAYCYQGFVPEHEVQVTVPDACGRVIRLKRRQKKRYVRYAAKAVSPIMIAQPDGFAICLAVICEYTLKSRFAVCIAAGVRR